MFSENAIERVKKLLVHFMKRQQLCDEDDRNEGKAYCRIIEISIKAGGGGLYEGGRLKLAGGGVDPK
jgi:hypothetical protein